jgi:hypothetical protein
VGVAIDFQVTDVEGLNLSSRNDAVADIFIPFVGPDARGILFDRIRAALIDFVVRKPA